MSLYDIPAIGFVCSHTTVAWTMGPREAIGRPTERVSIFSHESLFLIHSKPGVLVACMFIIHLHVYLKLVSEGFRLFLKTAEYQLVGLFVEGVLKHGNKAEIHITVGALRLKGDKSIKIPVR